MGSRPFTKTLSNGEFDLSTPNAAYFAYVDTIIRMAATNGIQILLDPLDTGGLTQTALDNGVAKCRAYGQYLGNRYKNFPNLIWLNGNDFQGWRTAADDAVITAIALGIKDYDTKHLQTVELDYLVSSSLDDPNWKPIVGLNLAYTYYPTYDEVLHAYRQSKTVPVFMGEAHYEFESVGYDVAEYGTPLVLRHQEYWTLLSGGAGQIYGNGYTWPFLNGWQANLDSPGVTQLQYVTALFAPRAWYNLVPDTNHTVLTSGYGTYSTGGLVSASDYATAARTTDGTLAMAYLPTVRTVTINMASMNGPVMAWWYDPANGTYFRINGSLFSNTGAQNFTPPGDNSDGDGDWVLVLTADGTKPTMTITAPTSGQRWSNAVFNVTGMATDNVQVSNVMYQLNGSGWNPAATTNNWTNWTAQVNLTPGTNHLSVYAMDTSGNLSTTNQVSFVYVPVAVLTVETNGNGTISPNYNGESLAVGNNYAMTATAATGFKFTGWTGSSTTNGATLEFVMASNLVFTANFMDVTKPTLTITAPTSGQRWSNAVFMVKGTAGDNFAVSGIYYLLNDSVWTNASGTTNWSATVSLVPGTNHLWVYATDFAGNNSLTNSASVDFVVTNQLAVSATGLGTISPDYSNAWLELGRNYSMTAKAASGFVCSNWVVSTNWLGSVKINNATVKFMMQSNLTLQVNFTDVTRPTLTITAPKSGQHLTSALANVTGTASDNWKVSNVWYQLNGNVWSVANTTNVWTNWWVTLPLVSGTNTVKAYAMDLGGNFSTTKSVSFVSSNTFQLELNLVTQPLQSNALRLQISPGITGTIQVSTDLVNWQTLTNFVGTNPIINFHDAAATNFNQRFYRAVVP